MSRRHRQERELTEPEQELLVAVGRCSRDLADLLAGARRKSQKSTAVFASEHIASALHRGAEVYAEAFERAKVPNRRQLDRLLARFIRADEVRDIADEIAETEGCWRNFLSNLEREMDLGSSEEEIAFDEENEEEDSIATGLALSEQLEEAANTADPPPSAFCSKVPPALAEQLPSLSLTDPLTSRRTDLLSLLRPFRSFIAICLPSYLPSAAMRHMLTRLDKIKEDLNYFRCGVIGITWGPKDNGKRWAKDLKAPFPIYLDAEQKLVDACCLARGLNKVWGTPTMQFLGELQRAGLSVDPPPLEVKWTHWLHLGCAVVIASRPQGSPEVLLMHRSKNGLGDLPSIERLREIALDHFSAATGQDSEAVQSLMDRERRYHKAPDPSRLQLEPSSGMYYDPETRLYYDPRSQYHYDGESGQYVYWSEDSKCYVSAQHMYSAGPTYFQVKAMMQTQEANIYAKAVQIVDEREKDDEGPADAEPKPPGT